MSNKIVGFLFVLVCLLGSNAGAQQTHTSPYSFIGIGDLNESGFAQNRGLAGLGIGLQSSYFLNNLNPAASSGIDTMAFLFEFGASGIYSNFQTKNFNESSFNGNIDYLAIGLPITKWMKISAGFVPLSKVGYHLVEKLPVSDGTETLFTIRRDIMGQGGVNQIYLDYSIELFKKLSLGFKGSYVFGKITTQIYDQPEADNNSVSKFIDTRTNKLSDFNYSFGFQYNDKLDQKYHFTIGGVLGLEKDIKTKSDVLQISSSIGHKDDTLFSNTLNENFTQPMFWGGGFSIYSESILFGFDYQTKAWSQIPRLREGETYKNTHKFVIGAELIPNPRTPRNYLSRMRYRLGGKYELGYINVVDVTEGVDEQIKEVGITFGVSLPMKRSKTSLNIMVELGRRGLFESNLLNQNYIKFGVDVSLHDIWFIKRKYD